jgi:outer membrane protein
MKFFNKSLMAALALGSVAVAQADLKVATVDMQSVFNDYYKTHEANAEIAKVKEEIQKDVNTRAENLKSLQGELQAIKKRAEDPSMSEAGRKSAAQDFELKRGEAVAVEQDIRSFVERRQRALQELQAEKVKAIIADISKVINDKAASDGYDFVLDTSAPAITQTKVLLFSKPNFDITPVILKAVNATAPEGFDPKAAPASEPLSTEAK